MICSWFESKLVDVPKAVLVTVKNLTLKLFKMYLFWWTFFFVYSHWSSNDSISWRKCMPKTANSNIHDIPETVHVSITNIEKFQNRYVFITPLNLSFRCSIANRFNFFLAEFELILCVIFQDEYFVTEKFPIVLHRFHS